MSGHYSCSEIYGNYNNEFIQDNQDPNEQESSFVDDEQESLIDSQDPNEQDSSFVDDEYASSILNNFYSYQKTEYFIQEQRQKRLNKRLIRILLMVVYYLVFMIFITLLTYAILILFGIGHDLYTNHTHCHFSNHFLTECPTKGIREITNSITFTIVFIMSIFTIFMFIGIILSLIGIKKLLFYIMIIKIIIIDTCYNCITCNCFSCYETKEKIKYHGEKYNNLYLDL